MNDYPQVLIPYDKREAITLRQAALLAGRSESTLRNWCQTHYIGRRVAGGPWMVSRPALQMFLDDDARALRAYLAGDRESELVISYFRRAGLSQPQQISQQQQNSQQTQ
ncbi:MAG: hypothetical protein ACR65T_13225 [Methylocystis sp.]|uniref:hypothetical protein n=1 Tax=Methylocystis sp. TaxID=1911079 RepID=UPI003DA58F93